MGRKEPLELGAPGSRGESLSKGMGSVVGSGSSAVGADPKRSWGSARRIPTTRCRGRGGGGGVRGMEEEKKRSVTKSCDTHVNIVCMNWVLHLLLAAAC